MAASRELSQGADAIAQQEAASLNAALEASRQNSIHEVRPATESELSARIERAGNEGHLRI